MTKNPGREELIRKIPVNRKNIHDAMDFAHREVKPSCAIPGNDHNRAYARISHDRCTHPGNCIPNTRRNYTGNASSGNYQPGTGAGYGGRTNR